MAVAHVNGIALSYHVEGTGVPCLVPRPINTSILERTLVPRLRQHFQLIFFDFRSSGHSGGTPGDFTLDQLGQDIDQLRQALGFEKVALVGWSALALVAIDVANAYPDSISHLILIGGPTTFGTNDDRYWQMLASDERKARLAENHARLDLAALAAMPPGQAMVMRYAANGPRYWYDATFNCLPLYEGDAWDALFWDRLVRELTARHADTSAILGLTLPIFLAQGVWDFVCPPIDWHEVIKTYANCVYHAFERSGHYPFYEEQDLFAAKLIDWISRAPTTHG